MSTPILADQSADAGNLLHIHGDSACEHCGEVVATDAFAFTLPPDDDPQGRDLPPVRLHALCANDYLMRVLMEVDVDPDEIVAVLSQ